MSHMGLAHMYCAISLQLIDPLKFPLLQEVGPLLPLVAALACAAAVGASCATFRRLRGAASQDSVGSGGGPPSSTLHVPPSPYLTPPPSASALP